jgi:hypothetical protein
MELRFMPEAEEALFEIGTWVEEQNTAGSGLRFVNRFIDKISGYALPKVKYPICRNEILASLGLSCIPISDWVIAFRQRENEFVVHYILFGPGLK